ncbi:serine hydrolase domain-containing protein [Hymenobacter terrenus]|uniref:serine hydrolase domain-containing protein n=1 Tax=Hymenobacter terrenus TaxID=1629124 RepID=UPI0006969520|nr:serine hydrolase domain-containing protein [Hymenobacter terrenus]
MLSLKHLMLKTTAILALVTSLAGCKKDAGEQQPVDDCSVKAGNNQSHPKAATYQAILDKYVQKGFPGLVLYIKTPKEGVWTGAAGKARTETDEPMRPCNLIYPQSIAKTFTAVSVMKLVEEDRISLDAPINTYLPAPICDRIANANQATVRQLLNHTSGIRNYTQEPEYLSDVLDNRAQGMTNQKNLERVYDKPALFQPGTGYTYSNTNYLLLARIIDRVTGASHADFFAQRIFSPLGLTDIYYKNEPSYPTPAGLPNTYRDLGNGELTNVTDIETRLLASDFGDGGMLGLASNFAKFVEAIFEGNLVSPASRAAMTTWVEDGHSTIYGLGLIKRNTPYGYGIGHDGDGAGCVADMYYLPDSEVTIVMGANKGLATPADTKLYREDLWNEVVRVALEK